MTLIQALIVALTMGVFMIAIMGLIGVLCFIDEGDYKKAIITSIFSVILTIIALAGMLAAF